MLRGGEAVASEEAVGGFEEWTESCSAEREARRVSLLLFVKREKKGGRKGLYVDPGVEGLRERVKGCRVCVGLWGRLRL